METTEHILDFTCDCGTALQTDLSKNPGALENEYMHFVWAVRLDGTRSNLGYCPDKHGLDVAMRKARTVLMSGFAEFQHSRY